MTDGNTEPGEAGGGLARPVAIVDIGSNSVRLVAYERLARALTPIFNEKVLCGLGKGVQTTRLLDPEAVSKALAALRCFRVLCRNMGIADVHVLATAATRDASNGSDFLKAASEAVGAKIELIGGQREAELSAIGVASSFHRADGVVGDLGGGSLELIEVRKTKLGRGVSLPLGGLALLDMSRDSPKRAIKIAREYVSKAMPVKALNGRTFYAVGGTWRALAKLHMKQRNYPLNVMHGYVIPAAEAGAFAGLVERVNADSLSSIAAVNSARRPLLSYGAVVLDEVIRQGRPKEIVISAQGVREGMLFERLDAAAQKDDPLLSAARELNVLRARSPRHGDDLCDWTDTLMKSAQLDESGDDKRLRHAACLLADIAWRAHPDYRSDQALNMIANGSFVGVDHPGRGYLALAVTYRHISLDEDVSPQLRGLVSARLLDRARILGAAMRVAYLVSAAMADVLPRTSLRCAGNRLILSLTPELADLASERLIGRLRQLGKLIGREAEVRIVGAAS